VSITDYFHSNDRYRRTIEHWDGADATAEQSTWIEIVRDNSNALKQASIVRANGVVMDEVDSYSFVGRPHHFVWIIVDIL
jgi:hypothetical protein